MNTPKRYHPLLVTLHWLTVILMFGAGLLSEAGGNSPINVHMILGALLLLIMVVRVVVRFTTKHPAWADTGNKFLNQAGVLVHFGLYAGVFGILGVGALIAYNRNLYAYIMDASAKIGRAGIFGGLHELAWSLILMLVFFHVGAAFYHQFILKDHLLTRMWYGK